MKNSILKELHLETRDEAVRFLKSLWAEEPQPCPLCGGMLDYMHKKAKKSDTEWKCPNCGNTDQSKLNVARRTCGYIGTQFWNQGRTQEIKERVLHL